MAEPRRPEPGLEVLWQRHIPQGLDACDAFRAAVGTAGAVQEALINAERLGTLEWADLVVTVSRRPVP